MQPLGSELGLHMLHEGQWPATAELCRPAELAGDGRAAVDMFTPMFPFNVNNTRLARNSKSS